MFLIIVYVFWARYPGDDSHAIAPIVSPGYYGRLLLNADEHLGLDRCVLYRDVDWHGVLPPPLLFIFSLRPAAWRYVHADCEHHKWLRRLAYASVSVARLRSQPGIVRQNIVLPYDPRGYES